MNKSKNKKYKSLVKEENNLLHLWTFKLPIFYIINIE